MATHEIFTLSLHDALPIFSYCKDGRVLSPGVELGNCYLSGCDVSGLGIEDCIKTEATRFPRVEIALRSEEHTSELQSHSDLVCRLLLEKKNLYLLPHRIAR